MEPPVTASLITTTSPPTLTQAENISFATGIADIFGYPQELRYLNWNGTAWFDTAGCPYYIWPDNKTKRHRWGTYADIPDMNPYNYRKEMSYYEKGEIRTFTAIRVEAIEVGMYTKATGYMLTFKEGKDKEGKNDETYGFHDTGCKVSSRENPFRSWNFIIPVNDVG